MTISHLHIGLPRLKPSEQLDDVLSIPDMRRAIMCGARDSRLIRECLDVAEHYDLPEEDMYVWLAYEALVRLEALHQACVSSKSAGPTQSVVDSDELDDIDGHI